METDKSIINLSNWPGAFKIFSSAKMATKVNLTTLILLVVVGALLNLIPIPDISDNLGILIAINVLTFIVSIYFSYAIAFAEINGARGKRISIKEINLSLKNNFLRYLIYGLASSLILLISFLLFIIPFFIIWPRISLWVYALIDGDDNPIKKSWDLTKGHIGKIYGIVGAQLLVFLLALTIIGIPYVIYWSFMYASAFALLYNYVKKA